MGELDLRHCLVSLLLGIVWYVLFSDIFLIDSLS